MKISIIYPDQQPASAALAHSLAAVMPPDVRIAPVSEADTAEAELVLAVFTLKQGSFAPTVGRFRELRDKKVALVPILTGEVERGRVMKTVWGSKKQFCGNYMMGAYLCPAVGEPGRELVAEDEAKKVQAFAGRVLNNCSETGKAALAA
ncbi:hypothetical protein C4J81_09010 [Deltaproteobacteria bacterium Smac51]|nr:hypothetical protein C4J81_09010 [Deltaproteobacteria bacterium Smac51]